MFFLARHDAGLPCRRPMISRTASIAYNVRRMVPVDAGSWLTHGICHSRIMAPCELLSDVRLGGHGRQRKNGERCPEIYDALGRRTARLPAGFAIAIPILGGELLFELFNLPIFHGDCFVTFVVQAG